MLKRILHFPGNSLTGGVGSVIMNLYRHVDLTEYEFDFCFPGTDNGPFHDEITKKGAKVFHSSYMRKVGVFNFIKDTRNLIKDNGPFHAVHIHSVHAGALTLLAAYLAGVKKRIYHVHNTKDAAMGDGLISKLLQTIFRIIIHVLATERIACGKDAGKFIYRNCTFTVLNNATDLNRFKPYDKSEIVDIRKSLGLPQNKIIVGNVFRFVKEKNPDFYIMLAQENLRSGCHCHFLLVGDGPLFEDFQKKIISLNIEDQFTFTGKRTDPECMLNAMDVFTLPSLFEGLPVTVMEAQACGVPCLISDNVTIDCLICKNQCAQIGLSESANIWLDNIVSFSKKGKLDKLSIVRFFEDNNYEISKVSKHLEQIYSKS